MLEKSSQSRWAGEHLKPTGIFVLVIVGGGGADMSRCKGCLHNMDDKCELTACVYRHINQKELTKNGTYLPGGHWLYEGKEYKYIGFEMATDSFICIEVEHGSG